MTKKLTLCIVIAFLSSAAKAAQSDIKLSDLTCNKMVKMVMNGSLNSKHRWSMLPLDLQNKLKEGLAPYFPYKLNKKLQDAHQDKINFIAFSPDDSKIATASDDQTTRIWDTNLNLLFELRHNNIVHQVKFSFDGTKIATASDDHFVCIWDASNGNQLLKLEHQAQVRSIAFSHSGDFIATGSTDGKVRIWKTSTESLACEINGLYPYGFPRSIDISHDDKSIVTGSQHGAFIFNLDNENKPSDHRSIFPHYRPVDSVCFYNDDATVAIVTDNKIHRIGIEVPNNLKILYYASSVSLNHNDFLLTTYGSNVYIFDAFSGKEIQNFQHKAHIKLSTFNRNGTTVAIVSDRDIYLWESTAPESSLSSIFEVAKKPESSYLYALWQRICNFLQI